MKRILLHTFFLFICAFAANAQQMRTVFAEMPDSIVPVLTKNNRLDCIDFADNKMEAVVENAFGGRSKMLTLTADYCQIRLTDVSDVALKLLPLTDTTRVVCVVHTCRMPAAESVVRFYTSDWRPLSGDAMFRWPADDAYWVRPDTCDAACLENIRKLLDAEAHYAVLTAGTNEMRLGVSLEALAPEDRKRVEPYVNKGLLLKWEKGRFVQP